MLVRPCVRQHGFGSLGNIWMGSDFDGAFAEFLQTRASEVFPVICDWTDAELGTIPCAYGTSENMLHKANLISVETVLVTEASGGVGSATVQLAKRSGAKAVIQVYELWEDSESLVPHFTHKNYHAMLELFTQFVFVESTNCAYLTEKNEPVYGPDFAIKVSFFDRP